MLVNLLNVPASDLEWERWLFDNRNQNTEIRQAILRKKNINLTEYVLYPFAQGDVQTFLINNSQSHTDFNSVLGLQGADLLNVDVSDKQQLGAWVYLNYQELYSASQALGI